MNFKKVFPSALCPTMIQFENRLQFRPAFIVILLYSLHKICEEKLNPTFIP